MIEVVEHPDPNDEGMKHEELQRQYSGRPDDKTMKYTALLPEHKTVGYFVEELMFFGDVKILIRWEKPGSVRINFKISMTRNSRELIEEYIHNLEREFNTLIQPWTETSKDFWQLLEGEILT